MVWCLEPVHQLHQHLREHAAVVRQPRVKVTLTVEYDEETGDHYLQFDNDMLARLGWQAGDELIWIDNKDGSWTLAPQTPSL